MKKTDLSAKIRNAVDDVAIGAKLTGHGKRTFERMATDVVGRVQSNIVESESGKATAAVQRDRARINAILSLPESKGRENAAVKLATGSDMTPEAAAEMLSGFPKHTNDPLGRYMSGKSPGINSDIGDTDDMSESEEAEAAANLVLNAGKNS